MAAAGAPYGYTLTIWCSGAVSIDLLGKPHVSAALLYLSGAALGYLVVATAAQGAIRAPLRTGALETVALGNVHLLSAGVAVMAVWGADHAVGRHVTGWALAGFVATALYLILSAVQVTLAEHRHG